MGLVEGLQVDPVPATLMGYTLGSLVSYLLNRRHTYKSERPHREAVWRFALVALSGFVLTGLIMALFTKILGLPYLPSQVATTLIRAVLAFSVAQDLGPFRKPDPAPCA